MTDDGRNAGGTWPVSDFALDARAGQLEGVVLRRGILATLVSGTPDW